MLHRMRHTRLKHLDPARESDGSRWPDGDILGDGYGFVSPELSMAKGRKANRGGDLVHIYHPRDYGSRQRVAIQRGGQ